MSIQDTIMQPINRDDNEAISQHVVNVSFPDHWSFVKLRDVLKEVDIRAEDLDVVESEQMPVLSLTKNKGLIPQSERFINRVATQDISNYKVIEKGQIVYNPFVLWEGAIYALKIREQGLVSPSYLVWEATNANNYFLDYLLRTPPLLNEYLRVASGVVQRRRAVRKDIFLNIRIPLPTPSEQQAIVQVLLTIQEAIQARKDELELEYARQTSLMELFFTHGLHNEQSRTSEIGEIPVSWPVKNLESVLLETQYGLSLPLNLTGQYPTLRMNNLVDGFISFKDLKYVDLEDATFQKFKLNRSDVLFNRTNSYDLVGKTSLFDSDDGVVFASYLIRLVADREQLQPTYLNWYLNWDVTQRRLKTLASRGVSQSNISASKLQKFKVSFPTSIDDQDEIVNILDACHTKITALGEEISLLEELFHAFLEELMTGKLSTLPLIKEGKINE